MQRAWFRLDAAITVLANVLLWFGRPWCYFNYIVLSTAYPCAAKPVLCALNVRRMQGPYVTFCHLAVCIALACFIGHHIWRYKQRSTPNNLFRTGYRVARLATGRNEGITHRYIVNGNSTAIIHHLNPILDVKNARLHIMHMARICAHIRYS